MGLQGQELRSLLGLEHAANFALVWSLVLVFSNIAFGSLSLSFPL